MNFKKALRTILFGATTAVLVCVFGYFYFDQERTTLEYVNNSPILSLLPDNDTLNTATTSEAATTTNFSSTVAAVSRAVYRKMTTAPSRFSYPAKTIKKTTPTPAPPPATPPPATLPPAPAPTPVPAPISNSRFGLAVGDTLPSLSDAELNRFFDDAQSLGVGWIRLDISWSDIQPRDSAHYDWFVVDRVIAGARSRNLQVLPILLYTPAWARASWCNHSNYCAPRDNAEFAVFVRAAVKRFAPQGIHQWEIWNEPNHGKYWGSQGNVTGYVNLLKAASTAVRAEDPGAFIVMGGLGPAATDDENIAHLDFLEQVYAKGAGSYFNAVGFHPYSFPVPSSYLAPWSAWTQMSGTPRSVRSIMTANGDGGKQIWMTEYGAPTGGPGNMATKDNYRINDNESPTHVSEELQATMLAEAIQSRAKESLAGPLFWHSYIDQGTSQNTTENFFGLLRADGSKKPAYNTLKQTLGQ